MIFILFLSIKIPKKKQKLKLEKKYILKISERSEHLPEPEGPRK